MYNLMHHFSISSRINGIGDIMSCWNPQPSLMGNAHSTYFVDLEINSQFRKSDIGMDLNTWGKEDCTANIILNIHVHNSLRGKSLRIGSFYHINRFYMNYCCTWDIGNQIDTLSNQMSSYCMSWSRWLEIKMLMTDNSVNISLPII